MNDLNYREMAVLVVLIIFLFWLGLYPRTVFRIQTNRGKNASELSTAGPA
jgi:NADH:ubiquinone oxidoreductase subunit 4 (subunit M)